MKNQKSSLFFLRNSVYLLLTADVRLILAERFGNPIRKGEFTGMKILLIVNTVLAFSFALCYLYQFVFLVMAYVGRQRRFPDAPPKRLAILIPARNEENVIGKLLASLANQDYPKESYKIFAVADNCTDNTAEVARSGGALVYERENLTERGKGYALDYLIKCVERDWGADFFDGYVVFDADNIAEPNYLTEMNKVFSAGYDVVTSYRNASNYGEGWRAGGQGMFFLRDSRVLNVARMKAGTNTYVMGTGFLFSRELCKENRGWPFHLLTEDGEFTMDNVVKGVKTGYCEAAMFYDEQATERRVCWSQRLRWCKGGIQIWKKYRGALLGGLFSRRFLSFWDMIMSFNAAYFLTMTAVITNLVFDVVLIASGGVDIPRLLCAQLWLAVMAYLMLLTFSLAVTLSEWKNLRASGFKKILYAFTFPVYLFTFVPAAFVALFKKVEWKTTAHGGKTKK